MTYQEKLDQAKDYLVNKMLPGYPAASFVDLERNLKDMGFFEPVDVNDPDVTRSIQPNGRPHIVLDFRPVSSVLLIELVLGAVWPVV